MSKKIVIIGGGPAGYSAALRAARLGADVVLAESAKLGGTCLNVGCIPTKSLLLTSRFYRSAVYNTIPGVKTTGAELDWPAAQRNKDSVVERLSGGVGILLRRSGVTVYNDEAALLEDNNVKIGESLIKADAVILATGSVNAPLNIPGADLAGVIDSTGALSLERAPKSIVIAGGGVIGVEFAALFNSLGSKTTIIELAPSILPSMDADISEYMQASLEAENVQIHTNSILLSAEKAKGGLKIKFGKGGSEEAISAEMMLIAIGRKPNTMQLELDKIGVTTNNGAIETDGYFRSNIPGIYAVGDCNGKVMLAHAAMAQGETAAGHIMGAAPGVNHKVVPACVYSSPEISSVGLTEAQVIASGTDYSVGSYDLFGNARAVLEGEGGFVKIISGKEYGEVLGVHIVGPNASELIAEAALCMSLEGTVEDIVNTIHAHPTVGEAIREAAMGIRNSEFGIRN